MGAKMLYGQKETLDARVASLVVAASTVEEFTSWLDAVKGQETDRNWEETYASNFLDGLQNPTYKGFKHSVLAVYHKDEEQRNAFWTEWNIEEVQSQTGRDRQADMLHAKKEQIREQTETEEDRNKTIEERFGLDKLDPWDRRTDDEKAADAEMKKRMKEMQKSGEMSGDSFGGADDQRQSRDRPGANDVPGAYSRTKAMEALGEFDPSTDHTNSTNEQLAEALGALGVPDIKGVFDDDKVPQKAKAAQGNVWVEKINSSTNEDGSIDIDSVMAHKHGDVDEIQKAVNEAAYNDKVSKAKAGRKSFSPEDFAAVLRGDGSADAVVHVKGDNRMTRQASEPVVLSEEAEQARREHQDAKNKEMKRRRQQAEKEADVKARGERDRGIFKGADLVNDDDPVAWDDLPENVRKELEEANLKRDEILVKNYPYNSELGGRALLPYDGDRVKEGMRMVGGINLDIEGTMTMNGPGVMIASRKDTSEDGYGVYARRRILPVVKAPEGEEQPKAEAVVDVWLVRVRAN
jgi:hypothetical protein